MKEMQTTDFKQSWRDKCLEWICGDANAYGKMLFLGHVDEGLPVGDDIVR